MKCGEGPYVITHYWEWWLSSLRYYPLLGMVVKDLTLLAIIRNAGGRPYLITHYWEGC